MSDGDGIGHGGHGSAGARPPRPERPGLRDALPPKGAGTDDDPFTPSTQAEIDWFKNNAPAGARIMIDGKLYTK